jgi:hypothetical protein
MPLSQYRRSRATHLQWIIAPCSLLFCGFLAWGYYHWLFGIFASNPRVLWTLTLIIPAVAWGLAKVIGSSTRPQLAKNVLLFAILSLITTLCVIQVGLLQREVPRLFRQAIHDAANRITQLQTAGDQLLRDSAVEQRIADIRVATAALNTEILNDSNCGEGIRAGELAANLKSLLPHFQTLSGKINCYAESGRELLEQRVRTYQSQVEDLITKSDWYISSKYDDRKKLRGEFLAFAKQAQVQLYRLESLIEDGRISISDCRHRLEEIDERYRTLSGDLRQIVPTTAIAEKLDLESIRNVDEWGTLSILGSRLDRPTTYVYLSLALLLDGVMIQLLRRGRALSFERMESMSTRSMIRGIAMRGLPR